jgi:hypothetical protein
VKTYKLEIGGHTAIYLADESDDLKNVAAGLTAAAQAAGLSVWLVTEKPPEPKDEPVLRTEDLRTLRALCEPIADTAIDYEQTLGLINKQQTIYQREARTIVGLLDAYKAMREALRVLAHHSPFLNLDDRHQWQIQKVLDLGDDE